MGVYGDEEDTKDIALVNGSEVSIHVNMGHAILGT